MLIGRLLLSLAVVLGAMWLLGRFLGKRSGRRARGGEVLAVLARQQVSRNSTVAVLKVVDRAIIVGVTDGQVTLLGDTDLEQVEALTAPPERPVRPVRVRRPRPVDADQPRRALSGSALSADTWKQALSALRERTVRKQ
ncbi:MAG TPA: flagellar biosynthetic protein FliO [Mycobacterium sp.]|nr:flagellar biosynthetic protein FliO [Mycobacterium sp.]